MVGWGLATVGASVTLVTVHDAADFRGAGPPGADGGGMMPLKPDLCSLATRSCNFPMRVCENSPDLVDWLAAEMQAHSVKPKYIDDLQGRRDAENRKDQGSTACSVCDGREKRHASRSQSDLQAVSRVHIDQTGVRKHGPRPSLLRRLSRLTCTRPYAAQARDIAVTFSGRLDLMSSYLRVI